MTRDRELFKKYVEDWDRERPHYSSNPAEHIACPAYLRIVMMGERAVPLIMQHVSNELEAGREGYDLWTAALHAITGEDPLTPEIVGHLQAMHDAWRDHLKPQVTRAVAGTLPRVQLASSEGSRHFADVWYPEPEPGKWRGEGCMVIAVENLQHDDPYLDGQIANVERWRRYDAGGSVYSAQIEGHIGWESDG